MWSKSHGDQQHASAALAWDLRGLCVPSSPLPCAMVCLDCMTEPQYLLHPSITSAVPWVLHTVLVPERDTCITLVFPLYCLDSL